MCFGVDAAVDVEVRDFSKVGASLGEDIPFLGVKLFFVKIENSECFSWQFEQNIEKSVKIWN